PGRHTPRGANDCNGERATEQSLRNPLSIISGAYARRKTFFPGRQNLPDPVTLSSAHHDILGPTHHALEHCGEDQRVLVSVSLLASDSQGCDNDAAALGPNRRVPPL